MVNSLREIILIKRTLRRLWKAALTSLVTYPLPRSFDKIEGFSLKVFGPKNGKTEITKIGGGGVSNNMNLPIYSRYHSSEESTRL